MKNLKNVLVLLVFCTFSLNSYAQSDVSGEWIVGEQNTVVKIEQDNDIYIGKIISSDNANVKIGKLMVKELNQSKSTWKGKIYSPKKKEWYDAEFIPKGNKLNLKMKVGFFSKTIEWVKK